MKTTELRTGNIHETNCVDIPREQIHSIRIDGRCYATITAYGIHLVETGEMEFKPIPLTEEWLRNFGLDVKHGDGLHPELVFAEFSNPRYPTTTLFRIYIDDDFCHLNFKVQEGYYATLVEFKYVHQFQNLYQSITGQELKSK